MAITSFDVTYESIPSKSLCSTVSSKGGNSSGLKFNLAANGSLTSSTTKSEKEKKHYGKSPYFASDKVQLMSRVIETRFFHKKTNDFVSSFPLAANIYKANSDEFKSPRKANKKVKKSVLTLPNDPAPVPQMCTVSDMNDSEYCEQNNEDCRLKVIKKRVPHLKKRKAQVREKSFEYYDRDAQYCSQLNINLDSSSTDLMKHFNGDGTSTKKITSLNNKQSNNNLNDVWAVLRNINRFHFRPSPPMSDESVVPIKNKINKRRPNHNDTRVIETCETEEIAYISSYELDGQTPPNFSPSSSIDRITVIDKENEFSKICEDFEKRILKRDNFFKDSNNNKAQSHRNKKQNQSPNNNATAYRYKENKQIVPLRKKKKQLKAPPDTYSKSGLTNSVLCAMESLTGGQQVKNNSILKKWDSSYSDNSESSKAELTEKIKSYKVSNATSSVGSGVLLNGIFKEDLCRGQESITNPVMSKHYNAQKRKPRSVTTMPSSITTPKLTQTEVRRKLAQIKFPLVILGKEQVSSNVQLINYDQFSGLKDHIWPFMVQWSERGMLGKPGISSELPSHTEKNPSQKFNSVTSTKLQKTIGKGNKQMISKYEKLSNNDCTTIKKKNEIPKSGVEESLIATKKPKSIAQLKQNMLKFLYKKSSDRNVMNEDFKMIECEAITSKLTMNGNGLVHNATSDIVAKPAAVIKELDRKRRSPKSHIRAKKTPMYTYPWAKCKWASDFIENVMKKIRSGVYYTQDRKKDICHKSQNDLNEASLQVGVNCGSTDYTQTCDTNTNITTKESPKQNNLLCIPGFNSILPVFEIQTLDMKQIAVKHCVTNVMLQFDVTMPTKTEQSTSYSVKTEPIIPLEVTESQTKIFKCKTTILNAMLPAELCSILPKIINLLYDSNLHPNIATAVSDIKTNSCLSIIDRAREYPDYEYFTHSFRLISPDLRHVVFDGTFSKMIGLTKNRTQPKGPICLRINHKEARVFLTKGLLKRLSSQCEFNYLQLHSFTNDIHPHRESTKPFIPTPPINNQSGHSAIKLYNGGNNRLRPSFEPYNLMSVVEKFLNNRHLQIHYNLSSYFDMLKLQHHVKKIEINMSMTNSKGFENKILVTVTPIDSLYKAFPKVNSSRNKLERRGSPLKCIEYIKNKSGISDVTQTSSNKTKKRCFYKLYRKCKSTTNIPLVEKCPNTTLAKITNLDDFLQILGSKKSLCSVFDGQVAKKILSSINEMKNWITEINPKQALLILLLMNKKDTPNLVRFRPILLQGIAVNRITRATELDMEIEVIERENLNKFSHYEGIEYLPETVTNYDSLLEELYWIAKTTASDYQKPFDESSERLLKSLIEKRKKLNPSYLRVMARYVGLGLLKNPKKT